MEPTLVFIDAGFLSKLNKHFGKGRYIKYDILKFAKLLSKKQNLFCKNIFYYTAPPFQSPRPTKEESIRYKQYDKFIKKLSSNEIILIREGRCQRLKINTGIFIYKQKAVDSLVIMDMMTVPIDFPDIKKIILIVCDSDFVPAINKLKKLNIKSILYTYYDKKRNSLFSTSNELIKTVDKYVLLNKADFHSCLLNLK